MHPIQFEGEIHLIYFLLSVSTHFLKILLRPGLRLISLNTNVCNNLNFWILLDFADPAKHLHWIYRNLHKAELNKEKVYIIGHLPPGRTNCYSQHNELMNKKNYVGFSTVSFFRSSDKWSHEYHRLVSRFNNTILGQFFGHTHFDEFEVFYAPAAAAAATDLPHANNVVYLGPSVTPHDGINPAYRIYTIDGII